MFDFLKKKLKQSVENIKNVFSAKEEEPPVKGPEVVPALEIPVPAELTKPIKEQPVAEAPRPKEVLPKKEEILPEEVQLEEAAAKEAIPKEKRELPRPEEEKVSEEVDREVIEEELAKLPPDMAAVPEHISEKVADEELQVAAEVESEVQKELEQEAKKEEQMTGHGLELIEERSEAISEKLEEIRQTLEVPKSELPRPVPHKKKESVFGRFKKTFAKRAPEPIAVEKKAEKVGFVEKISKAIFEKRLTDDEFNSVFKGLEISLLEANIAYEVIQILKENLKEKLVNQQVKRGKVEETILQTIEGTFRDILREKPVEEIEQAIRSNRHHSKPTSFLFLGVNGVGKTTSLAKMAKWLQKNNYSVVFAASDTFRAASIEQLEVHADKLKVRVIKHKYGADPAAVAFDAISYAKAHGIDCVLIDSAGRQHSNQNLMDELAKLKRVAKPDFTVFVADSLTGNDAVEQAWEFSEKVGYDFSILAKADVDQKGGAILSVSYISRKPIAFLGVGQSYSDLEPFSKEKVIERLVK
jgi:fused signal recognition particle receptor